MECSQKHGRKGATGDAVEGRRFVLSRLLSHSLVTSPLIFLLFAQVTHGQTQVISSTTRKTPIVKQQFRNQPLAFEENRGQSDARVKFLARGKGHTLFLTKDEAVLALRKKRSSVVSSPLSVKSTESAAEAILRMKFSGADLNAQISGQEPLPGKIYYADAKSKGPLTGNATFRRVKYSGIYPGIDAVYYGNDRQLEFDFEVAPGADPTQIQLSLSGAQGIALEKNGDLSLRLGGEEIRLRKPAIYQKAGGRKQEIEGYFLLENDSTVRFALGAYDPTRPLVIDPAIVYATYLGSPQDEKIVAIEANAAREVYVFGSTLDPATFPSTTSAGTRPGGGDCFLSKFSADGSQLLYSILIIDTAQVQGITSPVFCDAMALGPSGTVDIVHQSSVNGTFVKTLKSFLENPNQPGVVTYSESQLTALEGFLPVSSVKADSAGNVYVLGGCYNFRTQSPGPSLPNGFRTTPNSGNCQSFDNFFSIGPSESVLVKYDASGNLVYGTLIGGSADHETAARSLTVDDSGIVYVVGETYSSDFPTTTNAFQPACFAGLILCDDAFFMKIDTTQAGSASLRYSSFLGGSDHDVATEIAVDNGGRIYVAGSTQSGDFPQVPQPQATAHNYGEFLAQFDITQAGAAQELYGITFGGNQTGAVTGLVILPFGAGVAISGLTRDTTFPLVGALYTQGVSGPCSVGVGNACPFVSAFSPPAVAPTFSTFLDDTGEAFDVRLSGDSSGNLYALLQTTEFGRGTSGAYQPQNAGMTDALVLKIGGVAVPPPNRPPVLDTLLPLMRAATSPAGAAVFVSANWTDPDGDAVTATFVGPLDSAVGSQSVVGFTGATLNFPIGTSTFTVTLDDGRGGRASGSTQVTVLGSVVNTPGTVEVIPSPTFNSFDRLVPAFEPSTRLRIENVSAANVSTPGLVTLNIRSNVGTPPLLSGYQLGSPPYYYDFASTVIAGGPYTVCIDAAGMSFASPDRRMFFHDGTAWTDSTIASFGTPSEVCGRTSTLGTYAILHTIVPSNNAVTVAGSGFFPGQIDGPGGDPRDDFVDGGQATNSALEAGGGLAFDSINGLLYVGSAVQIRRVNLNTGIMDTIAGDGALGQAILDPVDGAPGILTPEGVDARTVHLTNPHQLALDPQGNLYIAEFCRVRRIDRVTNIITTVAGDGFCRFRGDGGPATSASLNGSFGLVIDSAGNLLVGGLAGIRAVDALSGIIRTVVSVSLAPPSGVSRMALTPSGDLYFVSSADGLLFRVSPGADGLINGSPDENISLVNTCAQPACPVSKFGGDGGPLTSATFKLPTTIAVDTNGDLLIADPFDYRIRRVSASDGTISTVVGHNPSTIVQSGAGFFSQAEEHGLSATADHVGDIVIDPRGGFFFANQSEVRRIGAAPRVAGSADLSITSAAAPDPVKTGDVLTYSITVANAGPANATGVTLNFALPSSVNFESATTDQGTCNSPSVVSTGTVSCNLGSIASGSSVKVTVAVKPQASGPLNAVISVLGTETDSNPSNNIANVTTTVNLGPAVIDIKETIKVTDTPVPLPSAMIPVTESIKITDMPTPLPSAMIPVSENIHVTDAVTIPDVTAPVVTPPGDIVIAATESTGTRGNASPTLRSFLFGALATDDRDPTPARLPDQADFGSGPVDVDDISILFPLGPTRVSFRFKDASGNIGTATASVTVLPPVGAATPLGTNVSVQGVDLNGNPQPVSVTFAGVVTQSGLTTVTPMGAAPSAPPGLLVLGVAYDVVTTAFYTPPVLICIDGSFVATDAIYHFQNGQWVDITLARGPSRICGISPSLSPFAVLRSSNRPPTATASGPASVEGASPAGAIVTLIGSGTDPDTGDTLSFAWSEGAATLGTTASITVTLPVGTHNLTLTVTDNHGASSTASVSVAVQDTKPPILLLPGNQILEATSPSGAVATFTASASDVVDGARLVICSPASGSTFPLGVSTVSCTSTDTHGNTAPGSFTVSVRDTTPPTIRVTPSNLTVIVNSVPAARAALGLPLPVVSDIADPHPTVTDNSPASFPTGTTIITFTAKDASGNSAKTTLTVNVQLRLTVLNAVVAVTQRNVPNSDILGAELTVQLGPGNDGINPSSDTFHFALKAGSVVVPLDIALSRFRRLVDGSLVFSGPINSLSTNVAIKPLSGGKYVIVLTIANANLAGFKNPTTIDISLGNDKGGLTTNALVIKK
jgi:uncharacterized repeat protein (TIGR01451 family)